MPNGTGYKYMKDTPKRFKKKFFKYWLLQEIFEYEEYPLAHNIFIANILRVLLKLPADKEFIRAYRKFLKSRDNRGTNQVKWDMKEEEFRKEYMNNESVNSNN